MIRTLVSPLKTTHHRLKGMNVEDLEDLPKNPYQMFLTWLLEIAQYGFMIAFAYAILFTSQTHPPWLKAVTFVIAFGFIRWLWIDIVKETSNAMRGSK